MVRVDDADSKSLLLLGSEVVLLSSFFMMYYSTNDVDIVFSIFVVSVSFFVDTILRLLFGYLVLRSIELNQSLWDLFRFFSFRSVAVVV